jgi:hypothetical protein
VFQCDIGQSLTGGEHWLGFVGHFSTTDGTGCDVGQCLPTDDSRIATSLNIKSLRSEKSKLRAKQVGESVRCLVKSGALRLLKYDIASILMCLFQTKIVVPLIVHAVTRVIVFSTL